MDFFNAIDADCFCIQETKMQEGQVEIPTPNYHQYWNSAIKKGYSGTAIFTKEQPISVAYDIKGKHNDEGRVITLEFEKFYLVNCYTPNAKRELLRLDYRMEFENDFRDYLSELKEQKAVILCGDLNVAHEEIDLKNPKQNHGNAGFSREEREKYTELLQAGFVDSFRYLYPERTGAYSWWSYRANVREKNIGWRIDYFTVSQDVKDKIMDSVLYPEIFGSDHCPIGLDIDMDKE